MGRRHVGEQRTDPPKRRLCPRTCAAGRRRSAAQRLCPRSLLLALAGGIALVAAGESPATGNPDNGELARLEAGETLVTTTKVPGRDVPRVTARAIIDAPPDDLWKIIDDCAGYERTMFRVLESEELRRDGNHVRCRTTIDQPFPMSNAEIETDAVHTVEPGKLYRREWELRRGDFQENSGSWTLEPLREGEATLVTYHISSKPNYPIPGFILEYALRTMPPRLFDKLREQVR